MSRSAAVSTTRAEHTTPGTTGPGPPRLRMTMARRYAITAYLFLLPAFAFFGLMYYGPILDILGNSFHTGPQADVFSGLENFTRAFTDPAVHNSFVVTLIFGAGTTLGAIVIGLGLALLVDKPL